MANENNNTPRYPRMKRVTSHGSSCMTPKMILVVVLLLLVPISAFSQNDTGKVSGNYNIQQTVEVGGHITNEDGNTSMYNTFVNVQDGFRLLDYTLQMRSLNKAGTLVDSIYFSNFGYGNDPERLSRLRMSKNKWYDFSADLRRYVNYFDYNLLGNPLNPANTVVPNSISTQAMNTRRNQGEFNLTLAPQSPFRVRLGFARSVNEGPSLSSYHEGTDILLYQEYANRSDRYQAGIDWKFAPRTQISFDQYYEHNKVNSTWTDSPFYDQFVAMNGATAVPVNLGAIYYPDYAQPCSNTPEPIVTGNVVKNTCGIYQQYSRTGPTRTTIPTSTLSLTSNYWKKLDLHVTGNYSSAELNMNNFNELAQTFVTRTNELAYQFTGPVQTKRISANVEGGFTYHITENLALSNETSWLNWRIPGMWNSSEIACFSSLPTTTGTIFTPAGASGGASSCLMYPTTATAAAYTSSSGANLADENFVRFLGEKSLFNTTMIEFQPSRRFGFHVGYRLGARELNDKDLSYGISTFFPGATASRGGCPALPVQNCVVSDQTTDFGHESLFSNTAMFGFFASPVDGWRLNADLEMMSATNSFTQISPRNSQKFKFRSAYKLSRWASVSGSINVLEGRRPAEDEALFPVGMTVPKHKDHTRSYSLNINVSPKDWLSVDVSYSFLDVFSRTGTCMPYSGLAPEGGALAACPNLSGAVPVILNYKNMTNTGMANLMIKPVKRVTLMAGFDLTSDAGANEWLRGDTLAAFNVPVNYYGGVVRAVGVTPALTVVGYQPGPNPFQPLGTLGVNWWQPSGSVQVDLYKGLAFIGALNYYDYNEKSGPGGSAGFNGTTSQWYGAVPRDFRANVTTLSLRYAF
jgi:hypothetical protein